MSQGSFRFLHAGGLRLGVPLQGLDVVPDHLHDVCVRAPYEAATKVFDIAVQEQVDFVILTGDIIDPRRGGPRAVAFLHEQFTRLQQRKINVYWCGGTGDHFLSWPTSVPLPTNVHIFAADRVTSWAHRHNDITVATLQGRSSMRRDQVNPHEFPGDTSQFTIGVAYGEWTATTAVGHGINYWALGGRSNPSTPVGALTESGRSTNRDLIVQYAGSCQGRSCQEAGVHGAYLVEVEDRRITRCELMPTDVVRWHAETIRLADDATGSGLQRLLRDRTQRLRDATPDLWVFTRWLIEDGDQTTDTRSDQLAASLRQGGLAQELTSQLRSDFGTLNPGVWTVSIRAETPTRFPEGWYEEDTVLGDLLRSVQHYQKNPDKPVELEELESDQRLAPELIAALRITSDEDRSLILRQVAALGVDLLRGDRVLSEEIATLVGWTESEAGR